MPSLDDGLDEPARRAVTVETPGEPGNAAPGCTPSGDAPPALAPFPRGASSDTVPTTAVPSGGGPRDGRPPHVTSPAGLAAPDTFREERRARARNGGSPGFVVSGDAERIDPPAVDDAPVTAADKAAAADAGARIASTDAAGPEGGVSADAREQITAFGALLERVRGRYPPEQVREITRAFTVARDAHEGQTRHSGEPYITHPVAVAGIVVDMQLDHVSVMGALLHDVLEDTDVERSELASAFGEELAHVVDGLSKLTSLEWRSKEEAQAESFRKMLLAMVSDIRVILIKLADRLHNMRTIGVMRRDKQRRIGRETLDVYAPIAARLGMYSIKNELEDLGFRAVYPARARVLAASVEQARRQHRAQSVARVAGRIETALGEEGIDGTVSGREKHLYSLYTKMLKKQLPFGRVFDLAALRVVVPSVDECYRVLGIVHRLCKPIPARFKDFIAVPKENGYQSLHTVLNDGADGMPIEVQIRTREMDTFAESGIAAHWAYKSGETLGEEHHGAAQVSAHAAASVNANASARARGWLSNLVELEDEARDSVEFVENVKVDLFPGEIYVFTPKGRIIQLPREATPVDFAYAVHSQIGNTCVAARVDRRLMSLSSPLESGQTVEIICGPKIGPSPMWLNSVVTGKARSAIRQHLRDLDRNKAAEFGERLLRRALARYDRALDDVPERAMRSLLAEFRFADAVELYIDMGLGLRLPSLMAERLVEKELGEEPDVPLHDTPPVLIHADDEPTLHLARCCRPIPGDDVRGFFDAGRGVAVHRSGCRNVQRFRRNPREEVTVDWAPETRGGFEVVIVAQLANQPGALARVTATMSLLHVNIENMEFVRRAEDDISIRFVLSVDSRVQLARIVRRLRNLTVVRSVRRDS